MKLHMGSFFAGFATGFLTASAGKRLKPVARDVVAMGVLAVDHARTAGAVAAERLEDMVEEAKDRARRGVVWFGRGRAERGPVLMERGIEGGGNGNHPYGGRPGENGK